MVLRFIVTLYSCSTTVAARVSSLAISNLLFLMAAVFRIFKGITTLRREGTANMYKYLRIDA